MTWNPFRKYDPQDFSNYLAPGPQSFKEKLIAECQRRGVSVFLADPSETSGGVYAGLRAVAPESELQSRLLQAIAVQSAFKANRIAWLALVVGLAGLLVAVAK